jgi:hypothetical protein
MRSRLRYVKNIIFLTRVHLYSKLRNRLRPKRSLVKCQPHFSDLILACSFAVFSRSMFSIELFPFEDVWSRGLVLPLWLSIHTAPTSRFIFSYLIKTPIITHSRLVLMLKHTILPLVVSAHFHRKRNNVQPSKNCHIPHS